MITKDNLNKYDSLFTKAEEVLKTKLGGDFDGEITGIEEYFSYIDILAEYEQDQLNKPLNERDEGFDPIFTFLPVDEPMFDIDLDKRTIDGSKFKGQQVVGDEIAEILWFSVDRFFDATDLYNTEIFIQWEREVKGGEPERGLSPAFNKILSVKAEEGKMIFGWPLHSGITEKPGNIKFAVRFYTKDLDANNNVVLTYSLSTLQSTLKINPSLVIDISDDQVLEELVFEKNQIIYDRLRASAISGVIPPAIPVIELNVYAKGNFDLREADLDEKGELRLNAKACVADGATGGAGNIFYEWVHEGKNGVSTSYTSEDFDYVLSSDTKVSDNDIYYAKQEDGTFIKIENAEGNPNDEGWYEIQGAFVAKDAGKYNVFAYNVFNNRREKSQIGKEWFVIPFAKEPSFELKNDRAIIGDDGFVEITVDSTSPDSGVINSYKWYFKANASEDAVAVEGATSAIHNAKNIGYYALEVANNKNNDKASAMSDFIRVSEKIEAPVIYKYGIHYPDKNIAPVDLSPAQIQNGQYIMDVNLDIHTPAVSIDLAYTENRMMAEDTYEYAWEIYNEDNDVWLKLSDNTQNKCIFEREGQYKCEITKTYNGQIEKIESDIFVVC